MISTSDIKIRTLAAKFKVRWIGPHPITHRTGAVTYRIQLPPTLKRLHPIFHVSKLKAREESDLNQSVIAPHVDLDTSDDVEYPVLEITHSRVFGPSKIPQYWVVWGPPYSLKHSSWEPADELEHCSAVDRFLARQQSESKADDAHKRRSPRIAKLS